MLSFTDTTVSYYQIHYGFSLILFLTEAYETDPLTFERRKFG